MHIDAEPFTSPFSSQLCYWTGQEPGAPNYSSPSKRLKISLPENSPAQEKKDLKILTTGSPRKCYKQITL